MSSDVIIRHLWIVFACCCLLNCCGMSCEGVLLVHFDSKHHTRKHGSVKLLKYCKNCPSAKDEGSMMSALVAKHAPQEFDVTGPLVYSLPNHAELSPLNNFVLKDNIAFVDRGKISIIEKVITLQRSGAVAVVIADTGECDDDFKSCGTRIGAAAEGGFGAYDMSSAWADVKIPVVIATKTMADKLRTLMEVKRRKFPKLGYQQVNILDDEEEDEEEEDEIDEDEDYGDDSHDEL